MSPVSSRPQPPADECTPLRQAQHGRLYEYRKWYFDALTRGGAFLFFYVASLSLLGVHAHRLNLMAVDANGERSTRSIALHTKLISPNGALQAREGRIEVSREGYHVVGQSGGLSVDLVYSFKNTSWSDEDAFVVCEQGRRSIRWSPIALRATVDGVIRCAEQRLDLEEADGYIDCLYADISPPRMFVSEVRWGRFHSPTCDVTYTRVAYRKHASACLHLRAGQRTLTLEGSRFSISETHEAEPSGDKTATLDDVMSDPNVGALLHVRRGRCLVDAEFLDRSAAGRLLSSSVARRWAGNPRGAKFLAEASIELGNDGQRVSLGVARGIEECARFDRG